MTLSILCVTNFDGSFVESFLKKMRTQADSMKAEFVIGADGKSDLESLADKVIRVQSKGYLESVIDDITQQCSGDYVLRLDDDEELSSSLEKWLKLEDYGAYPVWSFPRCNLWEDSEHFILNKPLWEDHQTRLGRKDKLYRGDNIHVGNRFGSGVSCVYAILHHKFLVRSYQERMRIAKRYEMAHSGAGLSDRYRPYGIPELCYATLDLARVGSGRFTEVDTPIIEKTIEVKR